MSVRIKKSKSYAMRVDITIPTEIVDEVEKGSFVVMVPVPTREFVAKIDKMNAAGEAEKLHETLIGEVSGIVNPETDEEYPTAVQTSIVVNDFRLANAVFRQYREDIRSANAKN